MSINANGKESESIAETIHLLVKTAREQDSKIWRDVAGRLEGGSRRYASINVGKISRLSHDGDTVLIPGSVLGAGRIDKKITVVALRASESAIRKLKEAGSTFKSLSDLVSSDPKAKNVRILR